MDRQVHEEHLIFSNRGVTLLQLADRNNRPGKFAKTGRNSIDDWKEREVQVSNKS